MIETNEGFRTDFKVRIHFLALKLSVFIEKRDNPLMWIA
jgi:hypothetical protein